jgi:hypothetical protein
MYKMIFVKTSAFVEVDVADAMRYFQQHGVGVVYAKRYSVPNMGEIIRISDRRERVSGDRAFMLSNDDDIFAGIVYDICDLPTVE